MQPVEEGRPRHWVLAPAHDEALLDAWWRLSFGQQQAHGIRDVPPHVAVEVPAGCEIRELVVCAGMESSYP